MGTLQPRKNLVNLVKAYALIADQIKEKMVVVGARSWKNSSLRELIDTLPVSTREKIEFMGYVSGEELVELYREAKLFTLLSLHEGFGLPILEAMTSGTAVLTAKQAAIPEVFQDAVEYADPFSPEDIAEKINALLSNIKKREAFQKKGFILSQNYSVKTQAENYLNSFNDIAKMIEKER